MEYSKLTDLKKKPQKTPQREILRAEKIKSNWLKGESNE